MAKGRGTAGDRVGGIKNKIKRQQMYHKLKKEGDKAAKQVRSCRLVLLALVEIESPAQQPPARSDHFCPGKVVPFERVWLVRHLPAVTPAFSESTGPARMLAACWPRAIAPCGQFWIPAFPPVPAVTQAFSESSDPGRALASCWPRAIAMARAI